MKYHKIRAFWTWVLMNTALKQEREKQKRSPELLGPKQEFLLRSRSKSKLVRQGQGSSFTDRFGDLAVVFSSRFLNKNRSFHFVA
mgnify:CR=1